MDKKIFFYVEAELFNVQKFDGLFDCKREPQIGFNEFSMNEMFIGKIYWVFNLF